MTQTDTTRSADRTQPGNAARLSSADAFGEIFRISRTAGSRQRFMGETLRAIVRALASPYGAIHVRYASEVVQEEAHSGPGDPKFWKASLQRFLTESLTEPRPWAKLLKARNGTAKVAFLSAPIYDPSGPAIGALAIVVPVSDEADWTIHLSTLESLCRVASLVVDFVGRAEASGVAPRGGQQASANAAKFESLHELAFAITHEIRNRLGCEQTALGIVAGKHIRLLSISGLDQINKRSPGVTSLRAAMEECVDAATTLAYPLGDEWSSREDRPPIHHLHRQWHATANGDWVASVPLKTGERVVAVLSLRMRADHPLTPTKLDEIRSRVEPFGASLVLAERAGRSLPRHVWESWRSLRETLTTRGQYRQKAWAAGLIGAALYFLFGTMNFEVTVPCSVMPAQVRHVAAPLAGVLSETFAVQGDRVRQGALLCEFDHRDLDQQRLELMAQLEVLEREHDKAMAERSPAAARLASANQELVRVRLGIVERRIEQSAVRSPIDGVVVQGDPRKLVGAVLPQGEPLFQVSPAGQWTLELAIPEWAADEVDESMVGTFLGFARPGERFGFSIDRTRPSAESRHAKNVFIAEATLIDAKGWLKPGMEGVAQISVGRRPVWWLALHRVVDYIHLKF